MSTSSTHGVQVDFVDLRKTFGGVTKALDGFTARIRPGEMLVLLGPSGCGKTTAMRALAGLQDIDSGEIRVNGVDVTGLPPTKRDMAMVFQSYSLFPHLSAVENVEFGLRVRKVDAATRRKTAMEHLELVGLADQASKYTNQMSGGQQQRVALARALAVQPRVLLLDEPLSALDAKVRVQLRDQIRELQLRLGMTALFVTHDQEEALAIADRIGVMRSGQLQQLDTPLNIYGAPANEFVATFIGKANRIPAHSDGSEAQALGQRVALLPGSKTGEVTVLVRPEAVSVVSAGADAPGVVTAMSFLGAHTDVTVRLGERDVVAHLPAGSVSRFQVGDPVDVRLLPTKALAV